MDLEKFRHGTPLTENINADDDGQSVYRIYGARCQYTKAQAPSVRFFGYSFIANLLVYYTMYVDNKSTKCSLGLTVCVCDKRQVTVCVAMCFKYRSQRLLRGDFNWRSARYGRFCVGQRRVVHRR